MKKFKDEHIIYATIIGIGISALVLLQKKRGRVVARYPQSNQLHLEDYKNYQIGIDVSHHQGNINWQEVKEQDIVKFVYVKATEGATFRDNRYSQNVEDLIKNELPVGAYHYFKPKSPVKKQFQNYMSTISSYKHHLVPMIDVEECNGMKSKKLVDSLKLFIKLIEAEYNVKPMIYTGNVFYNTHLKHDFENYKVCIGRYSKRKPLLEDKNTWAIWQYSEKGSIKGIPGNVDLNILNSDISLNDLKLNP